MQQVSSDLLDTPDLFWDHAVLEDLYFDLLREYSVKKRVEVGVKSCSENSFPYIKILTLFEHTQKDYTRDYSIHGLISCLRRSPKEGQTHFSIQLRAG